MSLKKSNHILESVVGAQIRDKRVLSFLLWAMIMYDALPPTPSLIENTTLGKKPRWKNKNPLPNVHFLYKASCHRPFYHC